MIEVEQPRPNVDEPEPELVPELDPVTGLPLHDDLIFDAEGRAFIEFELEVGPGADGYRLDRFLALRFVRMSRARVHAMLAAGGFAAAAPARCWSR
ncbi:MAG: hypothetical protein HC927_08675, partial [Deltaproteobacteria bacterium]|nr:hypothetical protein [Deltaproteobacteria bacterium]